MRASACNLPAGTPVVIRRRRLAVLCGFDPASGLAWMTHKGKRVYGRPNKELMKAIVEVTKNAKASSRMKP